MFIGIDLKSFPFLDFRRDNINVKELLLSLEKKKLLKSGKFLKVGSRSIDSWIKSLPDPENDEDICGFRRDLYNNYQLELDKYINLYENGVDYKPSLTEASEYMLFIQRQWVEKLRSKLISLDFKQNNYGNLSTTGPKVLCKIDKLWTRKGSAL